MKKIVFTCFGIVFLLLFTLACASNAPAAVEQLSAPVSVSINPLSQIVDLPAWLKPGMSLQDVQLELGRLGFRLERMNYGDACYEYSDRGIVYHFDIDPDYGLELYFIYSLRDNLDFQSLLAYFTEKYGVPIFHNGELIWESELDDYYLDIILYIDGQMNEWINIEYQFW